MKTIPSFKHLHISFMYGKVIYLSNWITEYIGLINHDFSLFAVYHWFSTSEIADRLSSKSIEYLEKLALCSWDVSTKAEESRENTWWRAEQCVRKDAVSWKSGSLPSASLSVSLKTLHCGSVLIIRLEWMVVWVTLHSWWLELHFYLIVIESVVKSFWPSYNQSKPNRFCLEFIIPVDSLVGFSNRVKCLKTKRFKVIFIK